MIENLKEYRNQQYHKEIQKKFSDIYFKNNDPSHIIYENSQLSKIESLGNLKSFYVTAPHREEIFFTEYPMEKKGKKFGTSEMRLMKFVHQTGEIYQVDKNKQAKALPCPSDFKIQTKQSISDSNETQWNSKLLLFEHRIKLTFHERGQIFVYFESKLNCFEIATFLGSIISKSTKKFESLLFGPQKMNEKIVDEFKQKLLKYRKEVEKRKEMKKKLNAIRLIQKSYQDRKFFIDLIERWRTKTLKNQEGNSQNNMSVKMSVRKFFSSNEIEGYKIVIKSCNKIVYQLDLQRQNVQKLNNNEKIEKNRSFCYKPAKSMQDFNEFNVKLKDKINVYLCGSQKSQQNESPKYYSQAFSMFQVKYLSRNDLETHKLRGIQSKKQKENGQSCLVIINLKSQRHNEQDSQQQQIIKDPQQMTLEKDYLAIELQITWKQQYKPSDVTDEDYDPQKLTMPSRIYQSQVKPYIQSSNFYSQSYFCSKYSPKKKQNDSLHLEMQETLMKTVKQDRLFQLNDGLQIHHYFSFIQNQKQYQIQSHQSPSSPLNLQQRNKPWTLENYSQQYLKYVQTNHPISASFNCVQKLIKTFKVNQLIDKFLLSQAFKDYSEVVNKGTKIYELLVSNSQTIRYYDVQKMILQFGDPSMRRMMNAIKMFDESLKINFTQPLFKLAQKIMNVIRMQFINVQKQSAISSMFDSDSIIDAQSCAFFVTLGVIKQYSSLLIYQKQVEKRALHQNTILLKLVIKKQFPEIWKKCCCLEVNIESLFGTSLVSLLSDYFSNYAFVQLICEQIWYWESLSSQNGNNSNNNNNVCNNSKVCLHLIAAFICLLNNVINSYKDEILTGQSLIVYLREKGREIDNFREFNEQVKRIRHLVEFHKQGDYNFIIKQLTDIYVNSAIKCEKGENKLTFGDLSHAVYSEFTDQHSKHLGESRTNTSFLIESQNPTYKLYIFINALHFDPTVQVRKMLIQIYQGKTLLYSHEFKNIDIETFSLSLQLEPKSLQNLVFYIKTKPRSYYYTFNIQKLESNSYHHFIRPLSDSVKQNSIESNEFIEFQVFMKNHVLGQRFQNVIPQKYCQTFLYDSEIKQNIIQTTRYLKNYRMKDNNFNLLYTKLAWYGNHYLIPHDRLLSANIFHHNEFITDKTSSNHNLEKQEIYSTLQYTRTIFGKGIIPKMKRQPHSIALVDIVKNNIRTIKNINLNHQIVGNPMQVIDEHKSTQQLLTYVLENFDMQNIGTFFEFYHKMCQLPLIDYLTYNPLTHSVLPPMEFNCIYVNQTQGVKLKFIVFFCEAAQERKQGEPWEDFIIDFTLDQLQELQTNFEVLQKHFFSKDHMKNAFNKDRNDEPQKVNKFAFVPSHENLRMKQFYTMFPQTFNFSFPTITNLSIDNFSIMLKYNILQVILNKFSKIYNPNVNKLTNEKQSLPQEVQRGNLSPQSIHQYNIKLIQDNSQIPNFNFYHLFRFMIETRKQHHVNIQLRKEKKQSSMSDIPNFTNTNVFSPRSTQSSRLSVPTVRKVKTKLEKDINAIKSYNNLGLIYGKYCRIEILSKQFKNISNDSSTSFNTTQSRTQTVLKPQQEFIRTKKDEQKATQQLKFYLVQERITRKLHRLKEEDILWKDSAMRLMYESL